MDFELDRNLSTAGYRPEMIWRAFCSFRSTVALVLVLGFAGCHSAKHVVDFPETVDTSHYEGIAGEIVYQPDRPNLWDSLPKTAMVKRFESFGFELGQGFLYGRPASATKLALVAN